MTDTEMLAAEIRRLDTRQKHLEQALFQAGEQLRLANAAIAGLLFERHLRIEQIIALDMQEHLH